MTKLERIIAALRAAGLDPTPQELADQLWLASQIDPLERPNEPPVPPMVPPGAGNLPAEEEADPALRPAPPRSLPTTAAATGALFVPAAGGVGGAVSGLPFALSALALPDTLGLARALRPLMRRVPSRTRLALDEPGTVQRIADEGVWAPQLRPAHGRWLELALVVDECASMVVWQQTITELQRLLERQGAFRDVRVWGLSSDAPGGLRLHAGTGTAVRAGRARSASELIDPAGRRLILVASDCMAEAWYNGSINRLLALWGSHGPLAIVQMLPERMWNQSALGEAATTRVRSPWPGAPNTRLVATAPQRGFAPVPQHELATAIITLEAQSLAGWARMLTAAGGAWASARLLPIPAPQGTTAGASDEQLPFELPDSQLEPWQLVQTFSSTASPTARRLASLLAVAPLRLPVMRLIQQTMLPRSSQVHLAEFLLSGLVRQDTPDAHLRDPATLDYSFVHDEVRELLQGPVAATTALEVLQRVSRYIEGDLGRPSSFEALLVTPGAQGPLSAAAGSAAFAAISAQVLRRIGGDFARVAERLEGTGEGLIEEREDTQTGEKAPRRKATKGATQPVGSSGEEQSAVPLTEPVPPAPEPVTLEASEYILSSPSEGGTLTIKQENRGYTITLHTGTSARSAYVPLASEQPAELAIRAREMLREIVYTDWHREYVYQLQNTTIPTEVHAATLQALARLGSTLYEQLFSNVRSGALSLGEELRRFGPQNPLRVVAPSDDTLFPWGLIYDGPPEEPFAPESFWGFKYMIEYSHTRPTDGRQDNHLGMDERLRLAFAYDTDENERYGLPLVDTQRRELGALPNVVLDVYMRKAAFVQLVRDASAVFDILYFFCYLHDDEILLSDELVTLEGDLYRPRNLQGQTAGLLSGGPLVHLNSGFTPALYHGLINYFFQRGARAVMVSHTHPPAAFAAEFSTAFFRALAAGGRTVGEVLLELRRRYWQERNNVLGLLYEVYGNADLMVERYSSTEPALDPVEPVEVETPPVARASSGAESEAALPTQEVVTPGEVVVYDSRFIANDFASWGTFSSIGGRQQIWVSEREPDKVATIVFDATETELVGVNKGFALLHGRVEFEYQAVHGQRSASNLCFYVIPMQNLEALIEVGTHVRDDPRNATSTYRVRYLVPHEYAGDGNWHHASISFDFRSTPTATSIIFAPRINEGCPVQGPGRLLVTNVRVFTTAQAAQ